MHNFFWLFDVHGRYLDPGSGSLLLQMLLALFLGIGFAVKVYWKKIKVLFQRKPQDTVENQKDQDNINQQ